MYRNTQTINIRDKVDVITARMQVRDLARALGMHLGDQARISLAASSLAQAMGVGETHHGQIKIERLTGGQQGGVQVTCLRLNGSPILEPGALGDVRWMVDEIKIEELPPSNVQVTLIKWLPQLR